MKTTGLSLNECLHVGLKFNQHIMDILLRFRLNKCAFIADIEEAFLMIAVAEQDKTF
uniref:Reverse transcriptase domain-containing protein n=1 Tax=Amphimedon queenslandica TaxID=400682 RepID=A0A1X7VFK9_AMPQE